MTGKEKCTILKSIRVRLAEVNNIPFMPHPCDNIGDCYGTCSKCDAESQWLLSTMKEMEKKGYPISYSLIDSDEFILDTDRNKCVCDISDSQNI